MAQKAGFLNVGSQIFVFSMYITSGTPSNSAHPTWLSRKVSILLPSYDSLIENINNLQNTYHFSFEYLKKHQEPHFDPFQTFFNHSPEDFG